MNRMGFFLFFLDLPTNSANSHNFLTEKTKAKVFWKILQNLKKVTDAVIEIPTVRIDTMVIGDISHFRHYQW